VAGFSSSRAAMRAGPSRSRTAIPGCAARCALAADGGCGGDGWSGRSCRLGRGCGSGRPSVWRWSGRPGSVRRHDAAASRPGPHSGQAQPAGGREGCVRVSHEGLLSRCCGLVATHRAMKALTCSTPRRHQPLWAVHLERDEFNSSRLCAHRDFAATSRISPDARARGSGVSLQWRLLLTRARAVV
jgi:hypothetical protein